jgi:hypothetical protein
MHTRYTAATIVFLLMLAACGRPDVSTGSLSSPTSAQLAPTPVYAAVPAADPTMIASVVQHQEDMFIFVHSLKERVAKSTVIVLGDVRDTGEIINLSREVSDWTKPATNGFSVGQVYHIQVTRHLKGASPDTISIINQEGGLPIVNPASITPAHIAQLKATGGYVPLKIGTTYLFFLDPFTGVDFSGTYYIGGAGAIYPWRFALAPDSTLEADGPHGPMGDVEPEFAPRPLAELLTQVDQLVQAEKAGAPTK